MFDVPHYCRKLLSLAALGASAMLAACAGTPEPVVGPVTVQPLEAAGQAEFASVESPDYRLRPSDTINVTVYREPDLSVQGVPVGSDGVISLPLVGAIRAEGRTTADLAKAIEAALAGVPSDGWPWVGLLSIFALVYLAFGVLAFGPLLEES